ncbi:MAG: peptidoglycan D,D-transpeptidase FtsI family protein [Solirubrobacteraceae bacterium]
MMISDSTPPDRRASLAPPQLSVRVAAIGGFALVMFALIFLRLWFLQVLDSGHYRALANINSIRSIPVAAPRGDILDSNGNVLVGSVAVPAVQISPELLPTPISLDIADPAALAQQPAADYVLYDKLARILGMSTKPGPCTYYVYLSSGPQKYTPRLAPVACKVAQGVASSQYANVTIKSQVSADVQDYIAERQSEFPGVRSTDVFQRTYPLGRVGAQVFGTLGQLSSGEQNEKVFRGVPLGSVVGQSGLEYYYNQQLQGTDGRERVKVDSQNQFEGYAKGVPSVQGDSLKTWLDPALMRVGQAALAKSIKLNNGTGGSFVAMDPQTGAVYAMGSLPSYNPSIFTQPISNSVYEKDFGPHSNSPLDNRAIDGAMPDGSTFKVITATAALESGKWQLNKIFADFQDFCMGTGPQALCLHNAGGVHYGNVDLQYAIEVSDDEFFYNLGYLMNSNVGNGGPLQAWAARYGIGHTTGIDLPGEASGQIGSPKLQARLWQLEMDCEHATGPYAYTNAQGQISSKPLPGYHRSAKTPAVVSQGQVLSGGCGIASSAYWTVGDNVNTGVGQYDDQVTATQLAVVYSAVENGGTIVTPHIGQAIESPSGSVLASIHPAPKRQLRIKSVYLKAIQQGLYLAANAPMGTSAGVMANFPKTVYGKTGTAELGNSSSSPEDAWYACYVPASVTSKPIVVVVNVQKGGFGAVGAAPVARQILSEWFLGRPGPYIAGTSSDA